MIKEIGDYSLSLHINIMARCVGTPYMLRDVMRCGIIPCWLPMRYLALFTVTAAAGRGRVRVNEMLRNQYVLRRYNVISVTL